MSVAGDTDRVNSYLDMFSLSHGWMVEGVVLSVYIINFPIDYFSWLSWEREIVSEFGIWRKTVRMSQSPKCRNLMDKWVLIVSEPDLLFLIWPRYHVSSQMNSKATGSWMMSHYWVSKITIDLRFLLIPKLLKCESREWLITSWRGVWGWNVEVTLSEVTQRCPGCQDRDVCSENRCVMVWLAELPLRNDNPHTETRSPRSKVGEEVSSVAEDRNLNSIFHFCPGVVSNWPVFLSHNSSLKSPLLWQRGGCRAAVGWRTEHFVCLLLLFAVTFRWMANRVSFCSFVLFLWWKCSFVRY